MTAPRRILRLLILAPPAAALLFGAWFWISWTRGGGEPSTAPVAVRIPEGAGPAAAADSLAAHGLIERTDVFRWGSRLEGFDRRLRAGTHLLPEGASPRELARRLATGPTVPVRFTLPEGLGTAEAAARVADAFPWEATAFLDALDTVATDLIRRPGWLPADRTPGDLVAALDRLPDSRRYSPGEGYLFPETYHLAEGAPPEDVVAVVVGACLDTLAGLLGSEAVDPRAAGLTPHEIVTLASIIEAETPLRDEMPRVAAVYLNRLAGGRPLEADPTVAYATDKRGERILYRDLEVESDYNTYRVGGLPPGPIGSPGAAALRAVLRPDPDRDVFYFVADGVGGHVFSETWEEHERAVAEYRRLRRAGRRP